MNSYGPPPVFFRGRHWSAREISGIALAWREALGEQFRVSSDLIAMVMANHPEAVALFFALSSLPVPLILLPPDPRAWRSSPPVPPGTPLCLLPSFRTLAHAGEQLGLTVTVLPEPDVLTGLKGEPPPFLTLPGFVLFTSGSTGLPKPVYRSTARVLAGISALVGAFHVPPGGGVVGALPLAYGHGLCHCLVAATVLQSPLRLLERFDHRAVLSLFASGQYQYWAGTPLMADVLARCPLPRSQAAPPVCAVGGGRTEAVFHAFLKRFGVPLRRTYGTTEAGFITADTSAPSQVRPETVGPPLPGVQVSIGDDPREPFRPGQTGRIWVKSPWGMEGYGFSPVVEPGEDLEGWWPTSDIGFLDESGYLTLIGRMDDCVKLNSGYLANLADIAGVLTGCPGVTDVAVVPIDAATGPAIGVLVESDTLSPIELRGHLARSLPPWSHPQVLQVTAQLPRLPGGKPDRRACVVILEKALFE